MGTYKDFFCHLSSCLGKDFTKLLIGSDDEIAMHQAIEQSFPNCIHLLCIKHLKDNLARYLTDNVGTSLGKRNSLVHNVFELLKCKNKSEFTDMEKEILGRCKNMKCTKVINYLKNRIFPNLNKKVWSRRRLLSSWWTNNNNESLNHVLKSLTDWKLQKIPQLIETLYKAIKSQYLDVKKPFVKTGPYYLMPLYHCFVITPNEWQDKSNVEQNLHYNQFLLFKPRQNPNISTSTDQNLITVKPSQNSGKKIDQKTRSRSNKTTSYPK